MTRLSVNVNKIALLRNARGPLAEPKLMALVHRIVGWGADGITVHPRADRRHITPDDARDVAREVTAVETNFEGDVREEFLELVFECRPTQCTLVPVKPGELTSNHGWECERWGYLLTPVVAELHRAGIRTSVFVEPDAGAVERAAATGTDRVELYTEPYARAFREGNPGPEVRRIVAAAETARRRGIALNAGHDLTTENLGMLLDAVPDIEEVSIGHHLVAQALVDGLESTVKQYLAICRRPR